MMRGLGVRLGLVEEVLTREDLGGGETGGSFLDGYGREVLGLHVTVSDGLMLGRGGYFGEGLE